jgi:ketosteroid isomerase-like protein
MRFLSAGFHQTYGRSLKLVLRHVIGLLCGLAVTASAADSSVVAAVRAADDERVAATIAGDHARLAAIYSDDLRYVHSSGKIDNKAEHADGLAKRASVYEQFDYQTREFRLAAPGVMLMSGRVVIHSTNAKGKNQNDVNFLAVWREEHGQWKLLAWQAAKNLPPGVKQP